MAYLIERLWRHLEFPRPYSMLKRIILNCRTCLNRARIVLLVVLISCLLRSSSMGAYGRPQPSKLQWKMVWLWSMGEKSDAEVIAEAKSLGFNAIEGRGPQMVDECRAQGIQAVGLVVFSSAPKGFTQVLSPEEEERLKNGISSSPICQYGGEPIQRGEILSEDGLWCFDRPEALEYGKKEIDRLIAAGYDAIAFDYIGFRNFHSCSCPLSLANQERYRKAHPGWSKEKAVDMCSRDSLLSFYDTLIRYARSKKRDIVITAHIYPYFAPEPLYGNRINLDYCGQTVSWFFQPHWTLDKVRRYTHAVVSGGSKYHSQSKGAPFIGVYTMHPYEKDRRSPERLREELRIIKESGSKAIQMAELGNILNDPALAQVVREELSPE